MREPAARRRDDERRRPVFAGEQQEARHDGRDQDDEGHSPQRGHVPGDLGQPARADRDGGLSGRRRASRMRSSSRCVPPSITSSASSKKAQAPAIGTSIPRSTTASCPPTQSIRRERRSSWPSLHATPRPLAPQAAFTGRSASGPSFQFFEPHADLVRVLAGEVALDELALEARGPFLDEVGGPGVGEAVGGVGGDQAA